MHYTAMRARLDMFVSDIAIGEFVSSEIVAYGLLVKVQFFGNSANAAGGQFVLNGSQLLECDIHSWKSLIRKSKDNNPLIQISQRKLNLFPKNSKKTERCLTKI